MSIEKIGQKKISEQFIQDYLKSNYRIIGKNKHSAIKPCHWLDQRLMTGRDNQNCYKGIFGIKSNLCLQNTPSVPFCNHQCVFCWRDIQNSLGSAFNTEPDEPKELIKEMIRHQKNLIRNHLPLKRYFDNYHVIIEILKRLYKTNKPETIQSLSNKISESKNKVYRGVVFLKNMKFLDRTEGKTDIYYLNKEIKEQINGIKDIEPLINKYITSLKEIENVHKESMNPKHAAISLDGEPFLYPMLSDFVAEFKKRNMTTFIVSNGTFPERIEEMIHYPSQLYISLPAPNEKNYKKICRPMIKNGWKKIMQTMDLLGSLPCRTVVRITAVKNLNLKDDYLKEYYKIIERANPNFLDIKGFTLQAKALLIKQRLNSRESLEYYFPEFSDIKQFAEKMSKLGNFRILYENHRSRDILLGINWDKNKIELKL